MRPGASTPLPSRREAGGEVAHADVVRGDLQYQQRQRDLNDAHLNANRARLDLGVLLFPNPATPYQLAASLTQLPPVPSRAEVNAAAAANNPDVKAALEGVRAANLDVVAAKFAYVPDLSVSFFYGIDAPQFAIHASDGTRNLGYSAVRNFRHPCLRLVRHPRPRPPEHHPPETRLRSTSPSPSASSSPPSTKSTRRPRYRSIN